MTKANKKKASESVSALSIGRVLLALVMLSSLAFATGCSHVAPYERGILAHPTMTVDDVAIGIDEHVRGVAEGASGGFGGGGGGCGCN